MSRHEAETTAEDTFDDRVSSQTRAAMQFVIDARTEDIPDDVRHESKRCLLDFLGVCIGAAREPAPAVASKTAENLGGSPQASRLGTGVRLRATDAALVNGIAAHVFDFDDTHIPTILHASTPLYASGLALAEWRGARGADLITAHALGYELSARASLALYPEHYDVGWHMTGTTGTLGSATVAGRLLRLRPRAFAHALGIAATQAAGHREQFGAMTKSFHAGHAAEAGLLAALLAQEGYVAAPDSLQGRRGMFAVMATRQTPDDLTDGLGERWEIFRNGIKPYACGVVTHPPIDAVRSLGLVHGVATEDVEAIRLHVHPLVAELTNKEDPRTGLEGKFSVRFACAIALIDGTARERQFSDQNVHRSDVRRLMTRIEVVPSADIAHETAVAVARLADGRELTVHVDAATGTPGNRMSDADLLEKFHDLVDEVLGRPGAERLAEQVWRLDTAPDLGSLISAATPGTM